MVSRPSSERDPVHDVNGSTTAMLTLATRSETVARWRVLVLVALVSAIWSGATLAAIAGARRTANVVDRFLVATEASDASFGIERGGVDPDDLLNAVAAQPAVVEADLLWYASTGLAFDQGYFINLVGAIHGRWGRDFDLPIVLRGRTADPTRPEEVMITRRVADLLGVEVGDELAMPTWDRAEYEAWHDERGAYPEFRGPRVDVTVVGIVTITADLDASEETGLLIVVSPAFVDRWASSIGENGFAVPVTLRDASANSETLVPAIETVLGESVSVGSTADAVAQLRDATRTSSVGLIVFAVLVGLAGSVVVAFAIAREVRRAATRLAPMRALGATPRQFAMSAAVPIVPAAVGGAVLGAVVAVAASAAFPLAPGRVAEPESGMRFDPVVLAGGVVTIAAMLLIALVTAMSGTHRKRGRTRTLAPGPLSSSSGPTATVGFVRALGGDGARARLALVCLMVAGFVATTWFGQHLSRLGAEPNAWGYTWSSSPELGFEPGVFEEAVEQTMDTPGVASVDLLDFGDIVVDGRRTRIATVNPARSFDPPGVEPRVLEGRAPTAAGEIALGRHTAEALGVGVGDRVAVQAEPDLTVDLTVVSIIVPPAILHSNDPAEGAFVHRGQMDRFDIALGTLVLLRYEPGVDADALEARLEGRPGWVFGARSHARRQGAIANVVAVTVLVPWLAACFALLGLGSVVAASARRSGADAHDLSVLHAVGFTLRDLRAAAVTEAVVVGAVGLGLGLSVGWAIGRSLWSVLVDRLGVAGVGSGVMEVVGAAVVLSCGVVVLVAALGRRAVSHSVARQRFE